MWQVEVSELAVPVTTEGGVRAACAEVGVGVGEVEPVDAEHGIWLVELLGASVDPWDGAEWTGGDYTVVVPSA